MARASNISHGRRNKRPAILKEQCEKPLNELKRPKRKKGPSGLVEMLRLVSLEPSLHNELWVDTNHGICLQEIRANH